MFFSISAPKMIKRIIPHRSSTTSRLSIPKITHWCWKWIVKFNGLIHDPVTTSDGYMIFQATNWMIFGCNITSHMKHSLEICSMEKRWVNGWDLLLIHGALQLRLGWVWKIFLVQVSFVTEYIAMLWRVEELLTTTPRHYPDPDLYMRPVVVICEEHFALVVVDTQTCLFRC